MSGVGKTTTISNYAKAYGGIYLDTDDLRNTLNSDLGWSEEDRIENVRRYAELAKSLSNQTPVIVGCTTPLRAQRDLLRLVLESFILVELTCDRDLLIGRSVKNYYRRCGTDDTVPSLAGVNFPYESARTEADLVIDTNETPVEEVLKKIRKIYESRATARE